MTMTGPPATHTREPIQTVEYECAVNDCAHDVRPCPSAGTIDACKECSARSWAEHEGAVVSWDECQGAGVIWDGEDS